MRAKTVIVGGGVMGVSIAMYAARRHDPLREPVMLLERDQLGSGSSGRSGAVVRQFYGSSVLAGMARDSLRVYSSFASEKGRSVGFLRSGVLTLAASREPADIAALEEVVVMLNSIGAKARRVEAAQIRALVPAIQVEDGVVGAFEPLAGTVDPALTIEAMAALGRSYGAVIRGGCEVRKLVLESGRVVGIDTSDGRIDCEQVVVAAGPWTGRFLAEHGVELPLHVLRTEQHFVAAPGVRDDGAGDEAEFSADGLGAEELALDPGATGYVPGGILGHDAHPQLDPQAAPDPGARVPFTATAGTSRAAHPVLLDQELGFYTRCEPERGRTRVGRLDYGGEARIEDPDQFDETCSPDFVRWSRERLEARFPLYAELEDVGSEAALYTLTPDANAMIGELPSIPGVFVVSGFSGHGFKLAPSVGEGVAQMLDGAPVSAFDTEFFSPLRFSAGATTPPRPFGL